MSDTEKADLAKALGLSEKEINALKPEQLERRKELAEKQKEAEAINKTRTGVGTRVFAGQTRGKGALVITYENFDESLPETLPKSVQNFVEVTGVKTDPELTKLLIEGYNTAQYSAASDPLAEYVEDYWPDDAVAQFRMVVRNYSRGASVDIESAVALIKPGFDKQYPKPTA